jgi:carbon storage regulator CsrA
VLNQFPFGIGAAGPKDGHRLQQPARVATLLVLSRKNDEQLIIRLGDQTVVVRVLDMTRDRVRIGVIAPREVAVHREVVTRQNNLDEFLTDAAPQS